MVSNCLADPAVARRADGEHFDKQPADCSLLMDLPDVLDFSASVANERKALLHEQLELRVAAGRFQPWSISGVH